MGKQDKVDKAWPVLEAIRERVIVRVQLIYKMEAGFGFQLETWSTIELDELTPEEKAWTESVTQAIEEWISESGRTFIQEATPVLIDELPKH